MMWDKVRGHKGSTGPSLKQAGEEGGHCVTGGLEGEEEGRRPAPIQTPELGKLQPCVSNRIQSESRTN